MTIEQILAGIDIERRLRIRMQRAESHELVASADMVSGPVVPLQVFQQRQPLFELFQILAHGRCSLFWVERRRGPTVFPGEDGGRIKSLNPQRPEALEKRENRGPGEFPIAVAENLSTTNPVIERLQSASQR